MNAELVSKTEDFITLRIPLKVGGSILEGEELIQNLINMAGCMASAALLERFDTDGSPIMVEGVKMTSMGLVNKIYHTPYGPVKIMRHLYQSSQGGKTYCPLEKAARMVHTATPKFAKMLSSKFSQMDTRSGIRDLSENHSRPISLCLVQKIVQTIGAFAQTADESWTYLPPEQTVPVKTVSIGIDGTCMFISKDGWRQAMVGTIALYDRKGERLHTTYVGAPPEMGRETFLRKMEKEAQFAKLRYPRALTLGLADGAPSNWEFLEEHTEMQILDFYHAAEHLAKAAGALLGKDTEESEEWLEKWCSRLKHEPAGPKSVIKEMSRLKNATKLKKEEKEIVEGTIQYFRNNKHRMPYALQVSCNRPIGSGVTEAACKVIIKQRLCCSGMRWKEEGAGVVISLRCLNETEGRWSQFWQKAMEVGYPDGWSSTCH